MAVFGRQLGFTDETLGAALKSHLTDNFASGYSSTSAGGYATHVVQGEMVGWHKWYENAHTKCMAGPRGWDFQAHRGIPEVTLLVGFSSSVD